MNFKTSLTKGILCLVGSSLGFGTELISHNLLVCTGDPHAVSSLPDAGQWHLITFAQILIYLASLEMLFFLFSVGALDLVDHTLSPYADTTGKQTSFLISLIG